MYPNMGYFVDSTRAASNSFKSACFAKFDAETPPLTTPNADGDA
jgi:hypothetical protein